MKRISTAALAVAAALAAPAFAETVTYHSPPERTTTYYTDPITGAYVERTETVYRLPTTVYQDPSRVTYLGPVTTHEAPAPAYNADIVVTAPRMTEDQLITRDVVDRISSNPYVSGQVGVETYRNSVTLTGRVTTPGQVDRVERDARSVEGVREVTNLVRPRVGG